MKRYFEVDRYKQSCGVQAGAGRVWLSADMDASFPETHFEYTFRFGVGPWTLTFSWFPLRRGQ